MKLENLEEVKKLHRGLDDCDFHLATLKEGPGSISIHSRRGGIVTEYGDRTRYVSEAFISETHASLVREVTKKRAEFVAGLLALGVEVESKQ